MNEIKVVLIGDSAVGKTSILNRFTTGSHSNFITPTLGAAFTTKILEVNREQIKLQIWDTSGEEKYRSMAPLYYRGANAVLVVFDILQPESFYNLKLWIQQINEYIPPKNAKLFLIANKMDLLEKFSKQLTEKEISTFCSLNDMEYFEVSAYNGININNLFKSVASIKVSPPKVTFTKQLYVPQEKDSKCC